MADSRRSERLPGARIREGMRFLLIGGACFLLGLLLVYVFTDHLRLHYLLSLSLALLIVNVVGWLLNRSWTFNVAPRRSLPEFLRYLLVNLAGFLITLGAVHLLVSQFGMHYLWASAWVALGMTILNFFLHRHFSFRL